MTSTIIAIFAIPLYLGAYASIRMLFQLEKIAEILGRIEVRVKALQGYSD